VVAAFVGLGSLGVGFVEVVDVDVFDLVQLEELDDLLHVVFEAFEFDLFAGEHQFTAQAPDDAFAWPVDEFVGSGVLAFIGWVEFELVGDFLLEL
jgi:hypothetical protein